MKAFVGGIVAVLAMVLSASAETTWVPDQAHTQVKFVVTHMVITEVTGTFQEFDFTVTQPNDDFSSAKIEAVIATGSINTDNERRDNHLRSDDFFNAEKYPEIKFVSSDFEKTGEDTYRISGSLTIRDVTRPFVLSALYRGTITDPRGNTKAGFKAVGTINRQDFGVKWNKTLDTGGHVVSDEVEIILDVQLKQVNEGSI